MNLIDTLNKPLESVMRTFEFSGELGGKTLDLNLQPGIYTCNFYLEGRFFENQTIIIIE